MPIKAICKFCHKIFTRNWNKRTIYCSHECHHKDQRNGKIVKCLTCNADIYIRPCDTKRSRKNFCSKTCANKAKIYSDIEAVISLKNRLLTNSIEKNGCLLWQKCINHHGYGIISFNKKRFLTHRAMWFLEKGEWPKKLLLHTCDIRNCININHLFEGTAQDNTDDMMRKGRYHQYNIPIGSQKPETKINEVQALEVKKLLKQKIAQTEIAKQLNISLHIVHDIKRNQTWRHIQIEE